jgi:hypothetical protein
MIRVMFWSNKCSRFTYPFGDRSYNNNCQVNPFNYLFHFNVNYSVKIKSNEQK